MTWTKKHKDFLLRHWSEKTAVEIAKDLKKTEGAVYSKISRERKIKLQERIIDALLDENNQLKKENIKQEQPNVFTMF